MCFSSVLKEKDGFKWVCDITRWMLNVSKQQNYPYQLEPRTKIYIFSAYKKQDIRNFMQDSVGTNVILILYAPRSVIRNRIQVKYETCLFHHYNY